MHLTNYSVNKHNENFSRDEDMSKGSKRLFLKFGLKKMSVMNMAILIGRGGSGMGWDIYLS